MNNVLAWRVFLFAAVACLLVLGLVTAVTAQSYGAWSTDYRRALGVGRGGAGSADISSINSANQQLDQIQIDISNAGTNLTQAAVDMQETTNK
jgi:hypothetical protein